MVRKFLTYLGDESLKQIDIRSVYPSNSKKMFGLFKGKSPKQKLIEKHRALLEEAFKLSTVNRKLSDQKVAEAEIVMQEIERMKD